MYKCNICENKYETILSLSKHITNKHKYNGGLIQYMVDFENFKIPKCVCNKNSKHKYGLNFYKTCGDKKCIKVLEKNRTHSNNTKHKISNGLKISHKKGIHPGWKHINSDINKKSYPEKWFIKNVLEKYFLYNKYEIIEKYSFGKYFLDFALIDKKIDIEIDGQQHFITKNAIDHDNDRDIFLLNNGWRVYRISWYELKNNKDIIQDLLKWLDSSDKIRKYNINYILDGIEKNTKRDITKQEAEYEKAKQKNIIKILNSNINFSKLGWVKKVSKIVGINETSGGGWLKRNIPELYKTCYIRKSKNAPIA